MFENNNEELQEMTKRETPETSAEVYSELNAESNEQINAEKIPEANTEANHREEKRDYHWEPVYEQIGGEEKKEEKKETGLWRKILVAACCGLCFGLFAGLGIFAVKQVTEITTDKEVYQTTGDELIDIPETKVEIKEPSVIRTPEPIEVISADYSEVVEKVMPAMVSILNTYEHETNYWGQIYTQEAQSGGSGIIIAENETELLIATNNHVVDNAEKLEVTFIDGSIIEAQIKGKDAEMDLAVIAILLDNIPEETKAQITIARMGDSNALRLGEPVIAIGNALGYGQSVTGGYVSALNRELDLSDGSKGTFIQTDAAINHGNSGGALLNIRGEVIGINSNKISGNSVEGMGYAIPISAAEPIIGDLMTKETKHKVTDGQVGYMGIENPITVPEDLIRYYNFPEGVFIRSVAADSPAEKAGILNNDIIVEFAGEQIKTFEDLQEELEYHAPGSRVEIVLMRQVQGRYIEVEISMVLGTRPRE